MNKIYGYLLGVLGYSVTLAVHATERFDLLPDLPAPLAYTAQPAVASTISGAADTGMLTAQSVGQEPNLLSVIFSLAFVILLIYGTGIIYARLNRANFNAMKKQKGELVKSQVSVLSTTQLGGNKTLHVVELEGKRMLIGASSSTIQLIKDLGANTDINSEDEYSHIEIPNIKIPKIEIPKIEIPTINFSKLVTKAHKGIKDIETIVKEEHNNMPTENVVATEETEEKTTLSEAQDSPDEIIESLFTQQNIEEVPQAEDSEKVVEHIVDPDDFALYKKYL